MPTAVTEWNEKSTRIVTVAFFDDANSAVVPTSATYRIDDVKTNAAIVAVTAIAGLSFTVDIVVTSAQNAMVSAKSSEQHRMTVEFDYGAPTKHGNGEYLFTINDLKNVT